MKKTLLSALLLMLSVVMFAAKEDTYVLYTGFEDGIIPAGWTQENVVGQTMWVVESAQQATNPNGVAAGEYRLLIRNNSVQTQRYCTRLITPVIDLKDVTLPVLMFNHAQQQRTGDVDTLRVYYRSNVDSRWILLATYPDGKTSKYTNWTNELIELPSQSATYQLAFEGTDNFGYGIALDEIIVRPMPTCDVPSQLTTGSISTTEATLSWLASMDADSIELVVATQALDLENINESAIILHTFTPNFSHKLSNLTRNTDYYWYVNSYCSGEQSGWNGTSFRTRNLNTIPYEQKFNLTYASNTVQHMNYMSQGTSILRDDGTMEYMPFVNSNTSDTDCKNYSFDSTRVYVFTGARAVGTAIPAGEYVYGATPEMDVDDIRKLTVSFWGTAYTYVGDDYASGIIVGVMTNPDEFSTFVPVDTFYVKQQREFIKGVCDLSKYTGYTTNDTTIYGKYVAFASYFKDKRNIFYVDDILVDYTPEVPVPQGVSLSAIDYNKFTVNIADLKGADSWNLVIAEDFNSKGKRPSKIIVEKTGITGSSYTLTDETIANKLIQVYVQGVKGGKTSEYSLPDVYKVPAHLDTLPYLLTHNSTATLFTRQQMFNYVRTLSTYGAPWDLSYSLLDGDVNKSPWYYSSGPATVMTYVGEYIAMPAVENLQDAYIRFSFSPYFTTDGYVDDARIALGIMTDPFDITTFDSLAVFDGTGTLTPRQKEVLYAFSEYKGEGKYIALKYVLPKSEKTGNGVNIYYTNLYYQGECPIATSIEPTIGATDIKLSWKGVDTLSYVVNIYSTKAKSTVQDTLFVQKIVSATTVTIEGLNSHTSYYYNLGTICGSDTVWGTPTLFTTNCYDLEPVPYLEDFEAYSGSSSTRQKPACWNIASWQYYSSGSSGDPGTYYPYFGSSTTASYVHSGQVYMVIGTGSASTTTQWFSLPEFDAQVNTLQLSFWLRSPLNGYSDTLYIGLQPTDATDLANFEEITYIVTPNATGAYQEYIVRLDGYQGNSAGKRLTFLKRSTKKYYWYLDDVKVEAIKECAKITDVEFTSISVAGATVKWNSPTASKWEILMSAKSLSAEDLAALNRNEIDSSVVYVWETTEENPHTIYSKLAEVNKAYYVYVRGICDDQYGDWSNEAVFSTLCSAENITTYTEDFSQANNADCWTMGVLTGTTVAPSFNAAGTYLYMFNSTASDGAYAVMPPMDVEDMSKYQISFDAHGGTTATYLKEVTVGIVTNAADLSTFEPMNTLKLNQVSAVSAATGYGFDEAYRYTVRFSDYEGDWRGNMGNRVMFLSESGELANYIYIDNVNFNKIGSVLEPLEVWAVEAGNDYAVLTWDTVGTQYEVKVSSVRIDPETQKADMFDNVVNGNSVRVEGLQMLTRYYVYVRTVGADGQKSLWSNMRWFDTQCPQSYALPYANDFSGKVVRTAVPYDGADCWQHYYDGIAIEDYTSGSAFYNRLYASANKAGTVTADNGLYLGSTFGSATVVPKSAVAVLPAIDADLSKAMLEFDWKTSVTTVAETTKRLLTYGIAEYAEPLDSVLATVQWLDTLTTGENYGNWIHEMLPLNNYTGNGKYIVLCQFGGNGSAASTVVYAYLDNVLVSEAPEVFAPATIECGKTFGSTAELTWTQTLGDYKQWQVVAVKTSEEIPAEPQVQTFDTLAGVFTGLEGATTYDFYVRAVNDEGKVSPWVATPATGTTLYLVEVEDAFWDFEDKSTQNQYGTSTTYMMENGWLQGMVYGTYSQSNVPYLYKNTINSTSGLRTSWYAFSGDTCMRFYSSTTYGGYVVMPQINCNLDSMQLRFMANATYCNESTGAVTTTYAKGTYIHSLKVGYMTDPYDYSTFHEITTYVYPEITATVTIDDDPTGNRFYKEVIIPLYGAGEGNYIAFSTDFPTGTNQVYIDDVIVEKETGCAMPTQVMVDSLAYDFATITWKSPKEAWNIVLINKEKGDTIATKRVTTLSYDATNLLPQTTYTFAVQAVCDGEQGSDWVEINFTTPCKPYTEAEAFWNFQDNLYQYGSSSSYLIPECSTVGGNTTTQSNLPYAVANSATYIYARGPKTKTSTSEKSLRFYTTTSAYNNYWAMPELDIDLDSMTLHFWGRAAYFYPEDYSTAANQNRLYALNSTYSRTLVIGAMTDADDFSTFVPLDTIMYDKVWAGTVTTVADRYTSDDKSGNDWWQEYAIPLAKYAGKGRIAIMAPQPTATSYFFVDDVEIVQGSFCTAASNVRVEDIKAEEVTITWNLPENASDSVAVALYIAINGWAPTDSLVEMVNAVIPSHKYTFTNLLPGRDYYYSVKHYCDDEDESAWSDPKMFTCAYLAPRFFEGMTEVRTYPVDWTRGGNTGSTLPAASSLETFLSTGTVNSLTETATSSAAWRYKPGTDAELGGTIYSQLASNSSKYVCAWLFSPVIELRAGSTNNMMLSFEMSMWSTSYTEPAPLGDNDRFMVLLSEDGGNTWTEKNSWTWATDGTGDFDFNQVTNERRTWYVDMTDYVGKTVKLAFFADTREGIASGNYLHLDNFQLNNFSMSEYEAQICRWNDYKDATFFIDADDLVVGKTTKYDEFIQGEKDGVVDKLTILNLTVDCDTTTYFEATICEGSDYTDNGFEILDVKASDTYKVKLEGANTCDSIAILNLTVIPKIRVTIEETICQGVYYEFKGQRYYTSTVVEETFEAASGCDSIVTLYLTVAPILEGETEEVYLCPGETYNFTEKYPVLSTEGFYRDTLQNERGCDSIVTVNIHNVPSADVHIRAAICPGERYDEYPFHGLQDAGEWPTTLQTVYGCDSVVTLHLIVATATENQTFELHDKIAVNELPYVLNGEQLLDENTTEGVYTLKVNLSCGEATLVITVGEPTGLNNTFVNSLAVTPNPVSVGEPARVLGNFSNATIEVISATGTAVYRADNQNTPITIPGLPTTGVYMIRLTSGDTTYQTKLVVK